MDAQLEAAFRELGIEKDVTPEQAHRAYVRLVKQRRPEDDPSGFQRLREAYELVRAALSDAGAAAAAGALPMRAASAPAVADEVALACSHAAAIESGTEWRLVEKALQLSTARPLQAAPPLLVAVETIAVLLATGAASEARALQRALDGYLAVVGESGALQGELAARALLVRDLASLAEALPADVVQTMADGFVSGTVEDSVIAMRVRVRAQPELAAPARKLCARMRSPVGRIFGPLFARQPHAPRENKSPAFEPGRAFQVMRWVVIVILFVTGACVFRWPWR
jgi:hypothetical protein